MSSFAGIYSRDQGPAGVPPLPDCTAAIQTLLSRRGDRVEVHSSKRLFVAKLDLGIYTEPGFVRPSKADLSTTLGCLAGHPFLDSSLEPSTCRDVQFKRILSSLDHSQEGILGNCNGTYALCHFNAVTGRLVLATDHVGSRPLYYHVSKHHIYFSTTLRLLEQLVSVPKQLDLQAAAECIAFSYPLGNRTPYADIKVLENGQYLVACDSGVEVRSYFTWDALPPTSGTVEELLDEAYGRFTSAVRCRAQGQPDAVALLSGGLDSRCIVTALHHLPVQVFSVTWACDGYLDGKLAVEYGKALGIRQLVRKIPACPTWDDYMQAMQHLHWPEGAHPQRPRLVFSGDGGSVGLGYDYLTEERISLMRAGKRGQVIDQFSVRNLPLTRMLHRTAYCKLRDALMSGIESEFAAISSHDPGRDLHIFYMKNDQRRHLHRFFEDIDISRLEYLLPFYDAAQLKLLSTGPVDAFLRHRFYHKWLDRFPPVIKSVAWQTYPGHLECPVALKQQGKSQWDKHWADKFRGQNWQAFRACARAVFSPAFPSSYIRRSHMLLALAMHGLRLRHYTYAFDACNRLHAAQMKCTRYEQPSMPEKTEEELLTLSCT